MEQNLQTLENWNELEYTKHRFYHDILYIKEKQISVDAILEIYYTDTSTPNISINTKISIENKGKLRLGEEEYVQLSNLFKLENLKEEYLYLLPFEDKMIKIALAYAKKKIKQFNDAEGENL